LFKATSYSLFNWNREFNSFSKVL